VIAVKKILWPIDIAYMDMTENIVPYINSLCGKYHAELHLIYVLTRFEQSMMLYTAYVESEELCERATRDAESVLNQFTSESIAEGINVKTVVVMGQPIRSILDYARGSQIDLIVMGTQGRNRLEEFILGSVSTQVVKRATAPVLTINPHIDGAGQGMD
jgi:nucleotide-binding universal stress UspA family protein